MITRELVYQSYNGDLDAKAELAKQIGQMVGVSISASNLVIKPYAVVFPNNTDTDYIGDASGAGVKNPLLVGEISGYVQASNTVYYTFRLKTYSKQNAAQVIHTSISGETAVGYTGPKYIPFELKEIVVNAIDVASLGGGTGKLQFNGFKITYK